MDAATYAVRSSAFRRGAARIARRRLRRGADRCRSSDATRRGLDPCEDWLRSLNAIPQRHSMRTSETVGESIVAPTSLKVDGARLWQSLMELAKIGATPKGGVRRLALTDLDRQGRDLVVGWLRDAGATIEIDGAGTIFAPGRGRGDTSRGVLTGSHVETQPPGGKFDGTYDVGA